MLVSSPVFLKPWQLDSAERNHGPGGGYAKKLGYLIWIAVNAIKAVQGMK